jgi:hypothetical protein
MTVISHEILVENDRALELFSTHRTTTIICRKLICLLVNQAWINLTWVEYSAYGRFLLKPSGWVRPAELVSRDFRIFTFKMYNTDDETCVDGQWWRSDSLEVTWRDYWQLKKFETDWSQFIPAYTGFSTHFPFSKVFKRSEILENFGKFRHFSATRLASLQKVPYFLKSWPVLRKVWDLGWSGGLQHGVISLRSFSGFRQNLLVKTFGVPGCENAGILRCNN